MSSDKIRLCGVREACCWTDVQRAFMNSVRAQKQMFFFVTTTIHNGEIVPVLEIGRSHGFRSCA